MLIVLCALSLATQIAYHILFARAIYTYKSPSQESKAVSLSVIIACHNELHALKRLVPALLSQEHSDYEIVFALDRSTDGSAEFLTGQYSRLIKVVEIRETPTGWDHKKYALQQAIKHASGEWLVFTDADCFPEDSGWLASFPPLISKQIKIVVGVSPYQKKKGMLNQYIRFETLQTAFLYVGATALNKPYMAVGRNLAIEKQFFERVGGYSSICNIVGGDDDLFVQKFGSSKNIALNLGSSALVYSIPKSTWKSYFHQKTRHFSVGKHYNSQSVAITFPFHLSHLFFLLFVPMMAPNQIFWLVLLIYLSIKLVSFRFVGRKLGIPINYMWIPIVDVMYAALTPIIAIRSKLVKDITWKN